MSRFELRRRDWLMALVGALILGPPWPLRADQRAMPVVGYLSITSPVLGGPLMAAFRQGLNEAGYVEGRNVAFEYRWAEGQYDRLAVLATDLVRQRVDLIAAAGGLVAAQAAKAVTSTIPILFVAGFDPVALGLVASLNRPGGNATGVSVFTAELNAKRLELLRELVPEASKIAFLVNPGSVSAEIETKNVTAATRAAGLELLMLKANSESDFEAAFALAAGQGAGALLVAADPFFSSRSSHLIALAKQYRLPTGYPWREYVEGGGLMSYGPSITEAYHQIGLYAGRILKGAKPGDLPVQLPTTFELGINLKTAKALGLAVSPFLVARADLVVE